MKRTLARLVLVLRSLWDLPHDLILLIKSSINRFNQYMVSSRRAFAVTDTVEVIKVSLAMLISSIRYGWEDMNDFQKRRNIVRLERGMSGTGWIEYTLYFS